MTEKRRWATHGPPRSPGGRRGPILPESSLGGEVRSQTPLLVIAGALMVATLWLSRKARSVTETEINLGKQDEGMERFESMFLSRIIVRRVVGFLDMVRGLFPEPIRVFNLTDPEDAPTAICQTFEHTGRLLHEIRESLHCTFEALFDRDISELRRQRKKVRQVQRWINIIIANIFKTLRLIQREESGVSFRYAQTVRRLQKLSDGYRDIVARARDHIGNNHKGFLDEQIADLRPPAKTSSCCGFSRIPFRWGRGRVRRRKRKSGLLRGIPGIGAGRIEGGYPFPGATSCTRRLFPAEQRNGERRSSVHGRWGTGFFWKYFKGWVVSCSGGLTRGLISRKAKERMAEPGRTGRRRFS